ncbi:uncharacterized protein LOC118517156 isoform X2 [Anopheles stephensi]|uniref:uncharacterized protein LOC118517156 isoform X2 n=1 Tax=Anopheles stephensi TaxID=30069 RepID=UPI0016588AA6|nr:uncharacterized protein LOC118517156 isoform X2 [Anopheles stephensi]
MSEDFDIYADLDHIEKEARQESHELLTLRQHIKELEERVQAAEQEKTDIVRKNKILLENVSSLLLTAKAEIQRKDATISELRKQCDDAVFRRKFHTAKSASCETRFTQTPPTLSVECCERLQSKCIIDDGRDSSRNRDREHDRVRTSKVVPERDRSHGRDRTSDRDKERHRDQGWNCDRELDRYRDRDQERNRHRDRDRCHDGDRERDRERYRERHRKSLYDRHHSPKERRSSERSRFKETHSERSRETKEPNPHEARTRDKERRSCEKPAPYRHGRIEDDDRYRSNPRLSDVKQGCLDIDRRTPEFHDGIKHDKLTNAGLNHAAEQMQGKSTDIKLQGIASNEVEQPSTSKGLFRRISRDQNKSTLTVDTNSKASGIQVSDDSRKQTSEGANSTANTNKLDKKKDKHIKSSRKKSKFEPADDVQSGAGKEERRNELCQLKPTTNEQNPTTLTCERKVDRSKSSQDDTIPKHCMDKGHQPQESTSSTANKHAEPTALISATDTLVGSKTDRRSSAKESDDLVLKSTSLDKACSSSAEASAEDACGTLVDLKRDKGEARSNKDIHLNAATNHGQDDNINALDDKKAKHNKSSKRKSKFEPADDVQCGAGKEEQRNELCQLKPTTNEQNPTKVHSSETSQHATIPKKATNEAHGIHLNQPQTSPFSTVIKQADPTTLNALAGSKTDRRSSGKESDDHVLKSMSFDASRISPGAGVGSTGNASSFLAANNAPKPAFSVATKKGDPAHEAIVRNEIRRKDNLQTDGVSPSVSNETSRANGTSMIKDNDGAAATGTKLQQPSSISEATLLSESNSHCLNLCDKRSNSYSAVRASSGKQSPKSLKMSIQTYFMSFNERVDMDETSSCAALNESIELSVAAEVEIETSKPKESTGEASKKPKVSTAEAVRERLERKRICTNVQKAALPSVLPMVSIYPKRKLSIDSVASVADKRQKLETAAPAHETKPSCETSPKLSSTYFSPITLSITSALDSIPSKLKSPDVKHSVWDSTLMTPMVVVHSPAKPSQDTGSQHVPNYYSSGPSDSSIQTIMESLFLTPIKNEAPDSVSPPSMAAVRNSDDGNPPQSLTATNYGLGEISSTPLSSKPLARFCPDDDHTTYRVLHKVTARQADETNSTIARLEGKGSSDPASAGPRGNVPRSAGTRKPALQKSSKHAQLRSDKHSEHRVKAASHSDLKKPLQSLGKRLHTSPRNRCARSQRNENNNYHQSSVMRTDKTPNVVPNSVCDKKSANDTVPVQQQPNDASSSASISKMLAATEVVNSALVYDHHQANEKVKPFKQSSTQQRQKSVTNVEPVEKSNRWRNAPSSSKCLTEELPSVSAPSASNSTTVIPSKTSDEIRPTQNPATTRKRSRKQMNADDEKRHGSTKKQSVESYSKQMKVGKKALCDNENTQPVAIRNCVEPIPQKTDPPRLAPTSKLALVIDEHTVERLNPQPLSAQPVERNCAESVPCSSRSIEEPPKADLHRMVDTSIVVPCNRENNMERLSPQTNAEQLPATANTASAADAQVRGKGEVTSTCVVSNVTLNLSLADNTSNIHSNVRKSVAPPVQHLREMRIVKESPSLMRIFIVRK